jgi:hypothetical protein
MVSATWINAHFGGFRAYSLWLSRDIFSPNVLEFFSQAAASDIFWRVFRSFRRDS